MIIYNKRRDCPSTEPMAIGGRATLNIQLNGHAGQEGLHVFPESLLQGSDGFFTGAVVEVITHGGEVGGQFADDMAQSFPFGAHQVRPADDSGDGLFEIGIYLPERI